MGVGLLQAPEKANLSFKSPSAKPHLNRTGSVFALPIFFVIAEAPIESVLTTSISKKGVYSIFSVPETREFTYEFCVFSIWKEPGKSLEVRFDFGPGLGFSKQLFGSSREGTELDRTYFKQFLSYPCLCIRHLQRMPWTTKLLTRRLVSST